MKVPKGASTNLSRDPVHHVPIQHESLLPRKLHRDLLLPLPPPRRQPAPRHARRRSNTAARTINAARTKRGPAGASTAIARPRHPRIVRGRGDHSNGNGSGGHGRRCASHGRRRRSAVAGTVRGGAGALVVGIRRCEARGWRCDVAEQAEIERGLGKRVLLREQRNLLHANICCFKGKREGEGGKKVGFS